MVMGPSLFSVLSTDYFLVLCIMVRGCELKISPDEISIPSKLPADTKATQEIQTQGLFSHTMLLCKIYL